MNNVKELGKSLSLLMCSLQIVRLQLGSNLTFSTDGAKREQIRKWVQIHTALQKLYSGLRVSGGGYKYAYQVPGVPGSLCIMYTCGLRKTVKVDRRNLHT